MQENRLGLAGFVTVRLVNLRETLRLRHAAAPSRGASARSILIIHPHGGTHAGEGIAHERNERAIAEADEQRLSFLLWTGIELRSVAISSADRTEVLPFFTLCLGSRTECAGFGGITCPVTNQSNSMRMAARCCLTVGLGRSVPSSRAHSFL